MCLYPRLILNPKYRANKKNGGNIPPIEDERVKYVPIGCQRCMECKKQKAREWQVRLLEHIKTNTNGKFITLTFNDESIGEILDNNQELFELEGYQLDNAIATRAIRLFLERWRKQYGTSLQHWFVTELGHKGTENIHLHGIVWTDKPMETVESIWKYGYVWKGKRMLRKLGKYTTEYTQNYVNETTIGYITKYLNKVDERHKTYSPKTLASPGIGRAYETSLDAQRNKFKAIPNGTNETYRTRTGHKLALPIYYRNKIYTEKQREQLWLYRLDKQERWVNKEKISVKNGYEEYYKLLNYWQKKNKKLGYGSDEKDWNQEQYEKQRRRIMMAKRKQRLRRSIQKGLD